MPGRSPCRAKSSLRPESPFRPSPHSVNWPKQSSITTNSDAIGRSAHEKRKLERCNHHFRKLADINPKSPQIQLLLAAALAKSGNTKDATSAYQDAVQLAPAMQAAHLGLIQIALANKDDAAALSAAQDYAEKQPGPASADTLARTYATLNRDRRCVKRAHASQAKYPNSATLISLTMLLRKQGDTEKADAMLTGWIAKHPRTWPCAWPMRQTQLTNNPAAAETQYRAMLKSQPYNLSCAQQSGLAAATKGSERGPALCRTGGQDSRRIQPPFWTRWPGPNGS